MLNVSQYYTHPIPIVAFIQSSFSFRFFFFFLNLFQFCFSWTSSTFPSVNIVKK